MGKDNFMIDGNKLLYHLERLNKWRRGELIAPIFVDLGINNTCNYRCLHCAFDYNHHQNYSLQREPLLRLMRDMGEVGVKSLLIGGTGEPTLNKNLVEAVEVGKASGLDIALTTNGSFLDYEKMLRILPLLTWIRFSILASSEDYYYRLHRPTTGTYYKVFENLEHAVAVKKANQLDTTISILSCVFNHNIDDMEKLIVRVKKIGVDYIMIKPPSISVKNENKIDVNFDFNDIKRLERYSDEKFNVIVRWNFFDDANSEREYTECLGLPFICQIDGNGGVYSCGGFMDDDRFCYGNINETSFKDILRSGRMHEVMEWASKMPEKAKCISLCRQHSINKLLFRLKNPPDHVNFI